MDLLPYVENLRREFAVAAEAGGPEARALAERLSGVLEASVRLTLLEALSAAADEITSDLAPGSVEVRLRGGDPAFVVTPPETAPPVGQPSGAGMEGVHEAVAPPAGPPPVEDGGTARMTLRLPEHLKTRVEEAAGRQGLSVNAWLVRAIAGAFERGPATGAAERPPQTQSVRGYTGWVR
ncbi:toxin-antitoxin system HicB family antitoxin [Actinomadura oligospora]|uniref:toxin-antitoxin system HicB family antitoxin n=1 Tax=Actinomadura oligospora TaxID=111804 RepID=UPI00047D1CD7|nr:toxin-antitoxin system HicB family antitoxin [Actinomadura oligospora]